MWRHEKALGGVTVCRSDQIDSYSEGSWFSVKACFTPLCQPPFYAVNTSSGTKSILLMLTVQVKKNQHSRQRRLFSRFRVDHDPAVSILEAESFMGRLLRTQLTQVRGYWLRPYGPSISGCNLCWIIPQQKRLCRWRMDSISQDRRHAHRILPEQTAATRHAERVCWGMLV